ncbi:MAG: reductive dehalogenase domain-containing protein [Dehalococcoidia bacterium]
MPKKVHHVVRRTGTTLEAPIVEIPVAEDIAGVPGIPQIEKDVAFYSREYPLETQNVEKAADREWSWSVYTPEVFEYRELHEKANAPFVEAAATTGEIEPTAEPVGRDITEDIRRKGYELGFGDVGFTKYDRRYTFASKKRWVKFPGAICVALEQDYAQTQSLPSLEAEFAHFGTYETENEQCLALADFIRSLGYHAQVHSPNDNSAPFLPMFVAAGMGQLGANGQLLSPHFGSRARLAIITTDGPLTYDEPVDYGVHKFCQECLVCADRCPARAITRDKVWYRGVEKNKLIYDRCRPVMSTYEGCAVCMKACPIQRYGMKPVMEHYVETGEVLGKRTHNLEGFELRDKGYFGPGELPSFDRSLFEFPKGTKDEWLFAQFRDKVEDGDGATPEETAAFVKELKEILDKGASTIGDE